MAFFGGLRRRFRRRIRRRIRRLFSFGVENHVDVERCSTSEKMRGHALAACALRRCPVGVTVHKRFDAPWTWSGSTGRVA